MPRPRGRPRGRPRKTQLEEDLGYEKLKQVKFEEPPVHDPAPPKPETKQETRLFQRILSGKVPPSVDANGNVIPARNVVFGTEKVYLTEAEAKAQGFIWKPKPFIGRLRRVGVKSKAREEVDESEGAGTDLDV